MTPIESFKAELRAMADTIREKTGSTDPIPFFELRSKMEEIEGGGGEVMPNTIILVDDQGNECVAVLTEEEVELTATVNDIREGMTAATKNGIEVGEKFIPPYYTSVGSRMIPNGQDFTLSLPTRSAYDYTSLQCIICPYKSDLPSSVAAEKVVIDSKVYQTNSAVSIAEVSKNAETQTVNLNIRNESGSIYIIRFFTYKEETK